VERRAFLGTCAALPAVPLPEALAADAAPKRYSRARLTDAAGKPLKAASLLVNQNYVFNYPFEGTPAFLLNLGRAVKPMSVSGGGGNYTWPGGAGAANSIVAFSAICSHQLTYPTRDISFISFRAGKTGPNKHADVIHCCSDHSQYDPAQGARVLSGPAPQPLAAILLEHDAKTDALTAIGTLGPEVFDAFFRKFEMRLTMESGGRAKRASGESCVVTELSQYCRQQVRC
jgi:arsenite oxidase small subunit